MAENDDPKGGKTVIKVEEEIEGEQIGTKNYRFSKIGESVPIKSDADFKFEMDSLPSRPLAVSERFGVIFVAHSSGFCVARTKDVMDTAKDLKNGGNGSSIQELSVVDVPLGKVSILALSANSSILAASVGLSLHFFSVAGLLNKDHEPSFSKSLNGLSCIKDMQWSTHLEDHYVVLTTDGNLYHGAGQDDLNNIMDNVDAVNWSMNGKFLAVARNSYISILSSKFKEKLRIMLEFGSFVDESDADHVAKVDSVRWVRPDCIILGCYRLTADGKEENYEVQLITVEDGTITNPSSNPVALSFSDAFLAINDDDIPVGSGPYMFLSYLDERELAFVANRKNTDQHIVLFGWSSDKNNGPAMIEISNDAWLPTINLQDNSDDNLILGLAVDKVYHDENTKLVLGEEDTEVSPCCVLLCLTVDGKLFIFHFASATGPTVSQEAVNTTSDEEEESSPVSSQHRPLNICNDEKQIGDQALNESQPPKEKVSELSGEADHEAYMRSGDERVKSTAFSQLFKGDTQQDAPVVSLNNSGDEGQSPSQKQDLKKYENQDLAGVKLSADSVSKSENDKSNKTLSGASLGDFRVSTESVGNVASIGFRGDEGQSPSQKQDLKKSENQDLAGVKSSADSVSNSENDKSNKTLFGASLGDFRVSTESVGNVASIGFRGSSASPTSVSAFSSSSSLPLAGVQGSAQFSGRIGSTSLHGSSGLLSSSSSLPFAGVKGSAQLSGKIESTSLHGSFGSFSSSSSLPFAGVKGSSQLSGKTESTTGSFSSSSSLPFAGVKGSSQLSGKLESTSLHGSSGSFSSSSSLPFGGVKGSAQLSGKTESTSPHGSSSSGSFSGGSIFSSRTFDVKSPPSLHAAVQGNRPDTSTGTTNFSSGPQKFSFAKMTSGSSASSTLLGPGVSAGSGFTDSLSIVSNAQQSLVKSADLKFSDKGNLRSYTPSRQLNSEPNLSEQRSVEEMARELDTLLDSIEGPGGFYDASVALHKTSVAALEEGIWALSDRCRKWTDTMDQGIGEVRLLLDKTVQVLARKIYMEAIVKQATDSQYRDIWNRQKLSSELEMKRRHILEINQNLTNQLIELERHLNTLELQRFGDKGDVQMSRRSLHTKHGPPRHIQSLHSLHNTMNAQLAAAEKLSECLSNQMSVLSIETEPVKKKNVKKELFETIGISYDGSICSPPGQEKAMEISLTNKVLTSSSASAAAKAHLKKSQPSAIKSSEPETARRRRDSLDRSWASIEPPKTTVKRMLLQEDRQMSPGRLSLPSTKKVSHRLSEDSVISRNIPRGALNLSQTRGGQDAQTKRPSEGQLNSSLWENNRSDSSKPPTASVLSFGAESQSTPIVTRDAARDSCDPNSERSRNRLTFTLNSNPSVVNDPKPSQQSPSFLEPSSNIFQKKSIAFSESSSKDALRSDSTATESPSLWSKKSQQSPFSNVSNASSDTAFTGKSFSLEASTKSNLGEAISPPSIASLPAPVTSAAPTSFVFKDPKPTDSGTKFGPLFGSSAPFPSFSSFGTPKEQTTSSSITPSVNIESNTSKSEPSPNKSESSKPQLVSAPKLDSKPDDNSSAQTSPPQTTLSSATTTISGLNFGLSVPSGPTSEPPKFDSKPNENSSAQTSPPSATTTSGLKFQLSVPSGPITEPPSSQLSSNATNSPELVSNSKPEQPSVVPPADGSSGELNQEDEMEEEAPDTSQLTLGNLGGFGLGSAPNPAAPKQNPFGASFANVASNAPVASFTAPPPSGGLFRPASFNIQSSPPSQPSQQPSFGAFSGGLGGNSNQSNAGQGFGQPAQIGSGQQALGSVLGSFGQSRQLGAGLPGSVASQSPFGGGFGANQSGGFAAPPSGGGFANLASGGGGFGALATGGGGFAAAASGGGGFGAAATGGGGFAAAATGGGGFSAAPAAGGGFAGAASGGFGAFNSQGGSGFSTFGNAGATARPPSQLFTQMRK